MQIKAYLRKLHDRDIEEAVIRLKLKDGEMSYLTRRGFRMALVEIGELQTIDDMKGFERRNHERGS